MDVGDPPVGVDHERASSVQVQQAEHPEPAAHLAIDVGQQRETEAALVRENSRWVAGSWGLMASTCASSVSKSATLAVYSANWRVHTGELSAG